MGVTELVVKAICNGGSNRINVPTYNRPVQLSESRIISQQSDGNDFEYVLVAPSRNSVNVLTKTGEVTMASPMDRSAFKDIRESIGLLGPNPNMETVDCKGIANTILDHFKRNYSGVKKDGSKQEDIVDLLREMMMYATMNHPMVMASPVAGPEVISIIFNDVLERIENA